MLRKLAIASAMIAPLTFGSISDVSAHGGGGGHGGFGGGGFGHGSGGFGHGTGFSHLGGSGIHDGGRFVFRDHFRGHRFFRNGFFFAGAPFDYDYDGYYDSCYRQVWTRWGWAWAWVCN
jgi:hypothetical protein